LDKVKSFLPWIVILLFPAVIIAPVAFFAVFMASAIVGMNNPYLSQDEFVDGIFVAFENKSSDLPKYRPIQLIADGVLYQGTGWAVIGLSIGQRLSFLGFILAPIFAFLTIFAMISFMWFLFNDEIIALKNYLRRKKDETPASNPL